MKLFPLVLSRCFKSCVSAVLLASVLALPQAQASGGGGAAGPEPLKFTVNVASPSSGGKYLQIELVFETAHPDAAQAIVTFKPKVQHAVILLLSGENADHLRTREGKHQLMENLIDVVNKVIDENEKTGVKEVLFTNFIIQ